MEIGGKVGDLLDCGGNRFEEFEPYCHSPLYCCPEVSSGQMGLGVIRGGYGERGF